VTTIVAAPGFMLLDERLQPVAFNSAALQILAFPTKPDRIQQPTLFLKDRISSRLCKSGHNGDSGFVKEYRSGGRKYLCRAFRFECSGSSEALWNTAVLLERHCSFISALGDTLAQFNLTARELETVTLLVEGLTSKEIATRMNISPNTVKAFLRLVMVKMDVSTRSGIVGKIVGPRG